MFYFRKASSYITLCFVGLNLLHVEWNEASTLLNTQNWTYTCPKELYYPRVSTSFVEKGYLLNQIKYKENPLIDESQHEKSLLERAQLLINLQHTSLTEAASLQNISNDNIEGTDVTSLDLEVTRPLERVNPIRTSTNALSNFKACASEVLPDLKKLIKMRQIIRQLGTAVSQEIMTEYRETIAIFNESHRINGHRSVPGAWMGLACGIHLGRADFPFLLNESEFTDNSKLEEEVIILAAISTRADLDSAFLLKAGIAAHHPELPAGQRNFWKASWKFLASRALLEPSQPCSVNSLRNYWSEIARITPLTQAPGYSPDQVNTFINQGIQFAEERLL